VFLIVLFSFNFPLIFLIVDIVAAIVGCNCRRKHESKLKLIRIEMDYLLCKTTHQQRKFVHHARITPVRSLCFSICRSAPAFLRRVAIVASGYHCSNPSIAKLHILLAEIWQSPVKSHPRITKESIHPLYGAVNF